MTREWRADGDGPWQNKRNKLRKGFARFTFHLPSMAYHNAAVRIAVGVSCDWESTAFLEIWTGEWRSINYFQLCVNVLILADVASLDVIREGETTSALACTAPRWERTNRKYFLSLFYIFFVGDLRRITVVRKDQCLQWIFDRAGHREVIGRDLAICLGALFLVREDKTKTNASTSEGWHRWTMDWFRFRAHTMILLFSTVTYASWSCQTDTLWAKSCHFFNFKYY